MGGGFYIRAKRAGEENMSISDKVKKLVEEAEVISEEIMSLDKKIYLMVREIRPEHPQHEKYKEAYKRLDVLEKRQDAIAEEVHLLLARVGLSGTV